ncbi:hypothetical protein SAMN05877809_101186 [Rhodobacter sp. JA431]|nr:hypothetical protein SAMN05877809_101186 [Rhodobacter sp. JA431]
MNLRMILAGPVLVGAMTTLVPVAVSQAGTDALWAGFSSLSHADRIEVQRELERADLYFAPIDGKWSAATEQALRRSVETIALASGDRIHPKVNSQTSAARYLDDLGEGAYRRLLYGGTLFEKIFFLAEDPVLAVQEALNQRAKARAQEDPPGPN